MAIRLEQTSIHGDLIGTPLALLAGMKAYLFQVRHPCGRRHAVICVEARYLSVFAAGQERPERHQLSEAAWRQLARELSWTLPSGNLPRQSPVVSAIVGPDMRAAARVRYVTVMSIDPEREDVESQLNALQRAFAGPYLTGRLGWW